MSQSVASGRLNSTSVTAFGSGWSRGSALCTALREKKSGLCCVRLLKSPSLYQVLGQSLPRKLVFLLQPPERCASFWLSGCISFLIFKITFIYVSIHVFSYAFVYFVCMWARMPLHICAVQRATYGSHFFPSAMWVLRLKLRIEFHIYSDQENLSKKTETRWPRSNNDDHHHHYHHHIIIKVPINSYISIIILLQHQSYYNVGSLYSYLENSFLPTLLLFFF